MNTDDHEVVVVLTRLETKLDQVLTSNTDHEARIRELEKNDLGRIIPFIIGLGTVAALAMPFIR
ncbi:hypothetical protein OHB41_33085 [Streptomyces sp. NBC_01571]|uniref:hypothetical protein n=1 Tax=Streptomyces sp. NBC_01571 TaxID=2975883 RepID=UPI002255B84F|nr:hypothetical protein [Streptomyces sp. NBC_01571]MCX4577936.1 hypothetical protein [Streptomyces sp. NBC_01571]